MSTPAAIRVWESHFTLYRTIWRSNVMGAVLQPFLYLLGMGLGVGALVDRGDSADSLLDGLTYFQFLAPGLLATTAMMISAQESLWPVLGGFKWQRTFHAQAASPLSPGEITAGLVLWQLTRSLISVSGVAVVLAFFDATRSPGLLLAIPFGGLTGVAFAAPISGWTATRDREVSFPSILRFGIIPLFLFGGAFYPVSQLPDWIEPVAKITPLWHGVQLCRGAVHDRLSVADAVAHCSVLLAFALGGWLLTRWAFGRRLAA
jgi:lipooligosaccharide transport system permease protein